MTDHVIFLTLHGPKLLNSYRFCTVFRRPLITLLLPCKVLAFLLMDLKILTKYVMLLFIPGKICISGSYRTAQGFFKTAVLLI